MYNGIGLQTARGTGTNGYVQSNMSHLMQARRKIEYNGEEDLKRMEAEINRKPNEEILDHNRKRQIEVKCTEFEMLLEDKGFDEDEIEQKVKVFREKLLVQLKSGELDVDKELDTRDSHARRKAAAQNRDKMRNALGLAEDYVAGSSMANMNKSDVVGAALEAEPIEKSDKDALLEKLRVHQKEKRKLKKERKAKSSSKKKRTRKQSSSSSSSSSDSDSDSDTSSSSESSDEESKKRKKQIKKKKQNTKEKKILRESEVKKEIETSPKEGKKVRRRHDSEENSRHVSRKEQRNDKPEKEKPEKKTYSVEKRKYDERDSPNRNEKKRDRNRSAERSRHRNNSGERRRNRSEDRNRQRSPYQRQRKEERRSNKREKSRDESESKNKTQSDDDKNPKRAKLNDININEVPIKIEPESDEEFTVNPNRSPVFSPKRTKRNRKTSSSSSSSSEESGSSESSSSSTDSSSSDSSSDSD